ncbi:MAG: glycosyl hydrolase [Saprospiraceae bacterium]|nr:glycosyl hydrolase [Saprospiraceae bacterium]
MKSNILKYCVLFFYLILYVSLTGQQEKQKPDVSTFQFRSIGPSFMSGRIIDLAVHPDNPSVYYVGVACGGVFKTSNAGTTFEPIFENYGSYSIGCVQLDPNNPNVVWVGTGEANNQRSVGYGDGIYKSMDGGKSFTNMGLQNSEHIGEIIIDPNNSDIIYVAAYGPLWSNGGDRGVYKSLDGGLTWKQVLKISEYTGVADIVMDPRDSKVLYASTHQRQRKGYGYVSGGTESSLYKTVDGVTTWTKINKGFPSGDLGRIAIAISPINPDILYIHLEAQNGQSGSYKSTDRGASWEKMSDYSTVGLYYSKIFPDPVQLDKIYVGDVFSKYSVDGGKTFQNIPAKNVHVDNHVIWINPKNNHHWLMGGDGGLYETFNQGQHWDYKNTLSITQFYRVSTDNSFPFYNIYGGTQDNSSMGGPSRTTNMAGIVNSDWFITQGGDGFESQVDWENPNIVYAQSQHGNLVRFDKKSGESVFIMPVELENEPALRWNWDSPLVLSSHNASRLYFGANKIYKSDDKGNSWRLISPDVTRQIDRNTLPIMDKIWSVDAIMKNSSTSIFGQSTSISESTIDENILYVGTDDGLIQTTVDGGKTWTKIDNIPGAPAMSYIPQIICSNHDKNVAYVVFNHHRYGDYKPYVFRTKDGGKTWTSIAADLPVRGSLYTIAEDHVNADILFVGSDFGVFVTLNGGKSWHAVKSGIPVIAIKDLEIQKRENDLVVATFGRGFYVLDDYSNLRVLAKEEELKNKILPVKAAWIFHESNPLGAWGGAKVGTMGDGFWSGENPPIGVVIRYNLTDIPKTIKERRTESEKEMIKKGTLKGYPSKDSLIAEDLEQMPFYFLTIYDNAGNVIRRNKQKPKKGINKYVWDAKALADHTLKPDAESGAASGLFVLPGSYSVELNMFDGEKTTTLTNRETFEIKNPGWATLPAQDLVKVQNFANECNDFARVVYGTNSHLQYLKETVKNLKAGVLVSLKTDMDVTAKLYKAEKSIQDLDIELNGNSSLEKRYFEALPGLVSRISTILYSMYGHSSDIPATQKKSLKLAKSGFDVIYKKIKEVDEELKLVQKDIEAAGVPYIKGSLPAYRPE